MAARGTLMPKGPMPDDHPFKRGLIVFGVNPPPGWKKSPVKASDEPRKPEPTEEPK